METSAKFARKRPVIVAVPANLTLTYLSQDRIRAGRSLYFSADYLSRRTKHRLAMAAGYRSPHPFRAGVAALLLTLAGCGKGEPSEAEIFDTLSDFGPTKMLLGDLAMMRADARKTGCEDAGENTYRCGVTAKAGKGLVLKYLFIRVDGKWRVLP
ncbi:hypothetical protein KTQ42_00325|uniref:hypothetical protein n=1 Tax=Noviherbaspirillum sp. L7-7A TaxID=2850560 RepID=UPI001C2CB31E|nr:hypothetical protein [Noviherbaspirillum sp. L7-7A]MBV0877749.1 hypothetical protein [Noviherbaspirillum sp. L7-7A]